MQLIYIYIRKFRNIVDQEVQLSDRFCVTFDPSLPFREAICVHRRDDNAASSVIFKDSQLQNVHIVVGKTGAGKTNIFQLIGMKQDERLDNAEVEDSYLLLYEDPTSEGTTFVIEPFNMPNVTVLIKDTSVIRERTSSYDREDDESYRRMPERIKDHFRLVDSMKMYTFSVNEEGHPDCIRSLDNGLSDDTFIFSGYDRNAFAFCPFDEGRDDHDTYHDWIPREHAEFDRTALWCSCRFLKEYIDTFSENNIKRKAALVINNSNWSERINQHIPDKLKQHDYWTYIERNREEEAQYALGKKSEATEEKMSIKAQYIHDLLTDYAIYLREWIYYIDSFSNDLSMEDNEQLQFEKEAWDHELDKQLAEEKRQFMKSHRGNKNRKKRANYVQLDPRELPDFENIDIFKRIDWLCEYIDYKGDNNWHSLLWQIYDDIKDIAKLLEKFDDKYFTNTTFELPIVDMYSEHNKPLIDELFERMEQYIPDDSGIFTKELLPYHFSCISSGEFQFAKVLGGIEEYCVRLKIGDRADNMFRPNLIYLMDEPETYMHPELCRRFIKKLDSILLERKDEANLQVLLSTHSPFFLSDCLPSNITRLDLDESGYCQIKNGMAKECFGANIQTILSDGFFLDFTIGEYSRQFLQNKWNKLKELLKREDISEQEKDEVKDIALIIPYIGDMFIQHEFEQATNQILLKN